MQLAAITYVCDQNEPSDPFLIELDCEPRPEGGTTAESSMEKALRAWIIENAAPEEGEDDEEPLTGMKFDWDSRYGDLTVELEGGTMGEYLIIGYNKEESSPDPGP